MNIPIPCDHDKIVEVVREMSKLLDQLHEEVRKLQREKDALKMRLDVLALKDAKY